MRPLVFIFLFVTGPLWGQDTLWYRMEQVKEGNLWLYGSNPAGLAAGVPKSFSLAEAGYHFQQGDLRQVYAPKKEEVYRVEAQTFRRLRQVTLYGRAGYAGEVRRHQQWSAMFNPTAHAVVFGDSIPGEQRGECYRLTGGFARPIGRRWAIGARVDWQSRHRAKDTDPRNQNSSTLLHLSPGVTFAAGSFRFGMNVTWQKNDEEMDYRSVGAESKNGFTFYPLWFFSDESFGNSMRSRRYYRQHLYQGSLQAGYEGRQWTTFCEAGFDSGNEEVLVNRATQESAGEAEINRFRFFNRTVYTGEELQHLFSPAFHRTALTGYDLQQELPAGDLVYTTLHRVKRSEKTTLDISLRYELSSVIRHWKVHATAGYERRHTLFRIYPADFTQTTSRYSCTAGYERFFRKGRHLVDCGAEFRFSSGNGELLQTTLPDGETLPEIMLRQNKTLLARDYDFLTALRAGVGLHLQYTRVLPGSSTALYGVVRGRYERSSGDRQVGGGEIAVGVAF